MSYLNKEERREKIFQAAVAIAYEKGLQAITARSVAEKAGISTGLMHHYFDSISILRAQAMFTIFDNALAREKALSSTHSAYERLVNVVLGQDTPFKEGELSCNQIWDEALFLASRDPDMKEACTVGMEKWYEEIIAILIQGRNNGEFQSELANRDLAWQLIAMSCGYEAIAVFKRTRLEPSEIKRQIEHVVQALLCAQKAP